MTRSYASFSQAADENGISRILIGFHFRKAVREGIRLAARSAIMLSTTSYDRFMMMTTILRVKVSDEDELECERLDAK